MAKVPSFILSTLYRKGSLRNTAEGCAFALQNQLGTGTVTGVHGLEIDGNACPLEAVSLRHPGAKEHAATEIGPGAPLLLTVGVKATVRCAGVTLQPGKHRIRLRVQTVEMGDLEIEVTDELSAERGVDSEEESSEAQVGDSSLPAPPQRSAPSAGPASFFQAPTLRPTSRCSATSAAPG